ncbi:hypothetical protein IPG36_01445 [bacterium]|nr:MAG: hypothetical protein IPG36_01445 [bacterium]
MPPASSMDLANSVNIRRQPRARGIPLDSWFDGSAIAAHEMTSVIVADPTLAGAELVKAGSVALANTSRSLGIHLDPTHRSGMLSTCLGAVLVTDTHLTYTVVGDCRVVVDGKFVGDTFTTESANNFLFDAVSLQTGYKRQKVYELLMPTLRPMGRDLFQNLPPGPAQTRWEQVLNVIWAILPPNTGVSQMWADQIVDELRRKFPGDKAYGVIDAIGDTPPEFIRTNTIPRPPRGSHGIIYTDGFRPQTGVVPTKLQDLELVNPRYREATAIGLTF